jgi:6-phosphogluconolactonase
MNKNTGNVLAYIGTYTNGKSEGIYVYGMDTASGALELASVAKSKNNPSYLAIDSNHRYLYAVNEVGKFADKSSGAVSAFSINPKTGELSFLNQQATIGTGPCHLSVDQTCRYAIVANYGSGSVAVLPINPDGTLAEASDFIQHEGSSVDPRRQERPHAHSVTIDRSNRFAFVCDLGLDKIMIYQLDLTAGKLKPNQQPWAKIKNGAGPRHFAFHPNGKNAYVINELDNTVVAFNYDETHGSLSEIQTISTLPEGFSGTSYCADIHVHQSGKFVYGSNRGHDSIVIFKVDEGTGKLSLVGHESTQGKNPRGFAIEPTGNFLLAANQNTDNMVVFKIDHSSGKLMPTLPPIEIPAPVCIKMIQM